MHKKTFLPLAAIVGGLVLLGAGCFGGDNSDQNNTYTPPPSETSTTPTTSPTPTTTTGTITTTSTSSTSTTTSKRRVINMTAKQFAFSPSTIEVNKGDTVEIHLTSKDVTHGFSIPEYNINVTTSEGNPQVITFVANQAGTFTYRCSVPCGSGHLNMKGTLIVK